MTTNKTGTTNDDWMILVATSAIIFFLVWLGMSVLAHYPVGH